MLRIALSMLIVAGIAALFGFGGIMSAAVAGSARTVFVVALALGVILLVLALADRRSVR